MLRPPILHNANQLEKPFTIKRTIVLLLGPEIFLICGIHIEHLHGNST